MGRMDTREAAAALVAGTTDLAMWCERQAQTLDRTHAATELRPMSPQECRHAVDVQREMLRRVGQAHVLWLTLLPDLRMDAPPVPPPCPCPPEMAVGPIRRWLRRVVG